VDTQISRQFIRVSTLAVVLLNASPLVAQLRRSGFIGVQAGAVPDAVRADLGLSRGVGVRVQGVVEGGSAKFAGIQPDDVITDVGDRTVLGVADFVELARNLRAGDVRTVRLRRGRETLILPVTIHARPYEEAPDADVAYDAIAVDGSLRRTIVTSSSRRNLLTPSWPRRQSALTTSPIQRRSRSCSSGLT